ncbi:caspase family protein [Actinoplanes siamensis]|uniref:Peptidase C14 caspase domain-containing protein n=1 Tax=Actinoplanes siamensis TaxID=1223317 RepID=A0A919N6D7_9ACTN|nr:caspase family protein [Actinoplanes siamensis]GIF05192.1 hypothetical protein Asi03nite_27300 [Actinoplanes siamensis]
MSTVWALVAGIDAYRAVTPLTGCRNDAGAALALLRSRAGDRLRAAELYDGEATRDAIVDGIRRHLGQAREGDTAIFWFAGHGSTSPLPPQLWPLEPSGRMQTLVCADSREGEVPDLYDKELSVLLDQVAATGCHVAVVLDSCHAAGMVRGELPEPVAHVRKVPPAARAPEPGDLIPELRAGWTALPGRSRVVQLAACRSDQLAQELPMDGGSPHGVFSWALLRALTQLGPRATYRELLAAARCAVEDRVAFQTPQLDGDESADQPFLGGALRPPASGILLRRLGGRWEIDAGACHGLPSPDLGPLRVAVAGDGPVRPANVVSVLVDRSVVEPDGWTPDPRRQYPVVITRLPRPGLAVDVGGSAELARLTAASPLLRVQPPGEVPELRFRGTRILGADESELAVTSSAPHTVRAAEHIARWRQVQALTNPGSRLAGQVRLEITTGGTALTPGPDGLIRMEYLRRAGGWVAPTAFIRLHNTSDQPLFCVLLDLTGRYRIHAGLFPGEFVGPRRTGAALHGRPVQFRLPARTPVEPKAQIRDWLKLIVAEDEFAALPFEQGSIDDAGRRGVPAPVTMHRDAGGAEDDPYDWTAVTLGVVTVVPG